MATDSPRRHRRRNVLGAIYGEQRIARFNAGIMGWPAFEDVEEKVGMNAKLEDLRSP